MVQSFHHALDQSRVTSQNCVPFHVLKSTLKYNFKMQPYTERFLKIESVKSYKNFCIYHSSFGCCFGIFGKRCFGTFFASPSNKCNSFGTPASTLSMLAFPIGRLLWARLKIPLIIAQCSVKVYFLIGVCLADSCPCIERFSAWKVLIFVNCFSIIPLQTKYSRYQSCVMQYKK